MEKTDKTFREECVKRGILYAFVPQHLEIPDRPELNVFPYNVMFMKFKVENGITVSGTAIYDPLIITFKKEGVKSTMEYFNIYGPECRLRIEVDTINPSYHGEKFVRGEIVGQAEGREWDTFFVHFTMLGLSNGERCKFEEMTVRKSN